MGLMIVGFIRSKVSLVLYLLASKKNIYKRYRRSRNLMIMIVILIILKLIITRMNGVNM